VLYFCNDWGLMFVITCRGRIFFLIIRGRKLKFASGSRVTYMLPSEINVAFGYALFPFNVRLHVHFC
jgi:hypothetical protein